MVSPVVYFWKRTPFTRLLPPFAAGIIVQWHFQVPLHIWLFILVISCIILFSFFLVPFFSRFKFSFFTGLAVSILFVSIGALLVYNKDVRNNKKWLGNFYQEKDGLIVTLNEPPVEKMKSFKANVSVNYVINKKNSIPVKGTIIIYFKKDPAFTGLEYGSQILLKKPLQEIKNSGNPGGFDYKRYCLFQGITHQLFLQPGELEILDGKRTNWLRRFIYDSRENILTILRKNIPGGKELGLAEALLIGYKNDLEQSLVQSYTNTGVVHIIAISGLHIGLIYWLLALLTRSLQKRKKTRWLRPFLIITGLWLFSLLAGAQPSVLRSALMFTCIVAAEGLTRRTSIFNTLAFSALILLCINPYWLWDVGFQLSYAAVLSIIIFLKPIYDWFYIKNKILDFIWKLNAITLAAQILTVPLSIYHFHQFPNYFLLTNFVAVPLSSIILLGEIFLCAIAWLPAVALLVGKALQWLIWVMNTWIERIESLRFSLLDGLQISLLQAGLLIVFAAGISY
ncbi:MAG: ComEC family competence protein, partial [Chitinophagaceae bacterium]|nr:ComEC family competence protein [Chitinophagaceae bacterium]